MELKKRKELFSRIAQVRYDHREGGRYAYVELMALIRQLADLLRRELPGHPFIAGLNNCSELLNALVPLRFGPEHRMIFDQKLAEIAAMEQQLLGDARLASDASLTVALQR